MRSFLRVFVFVSLISSSAVAQCIPDLNITVPGIYPDSATGLASGTVGLPYNQVIQIKAPTDTVIFYQGNYVVATIDSIILVSFTNLPPGITYACNPATCLFPGGSNGCVLISGTPSTAGTYNPVAIVRTKAKVFGFPLTQIDTVDYYTINISTTQGLSGAQSKKFEVFQNDPNPFSSYTNISYYCPVPMTVSLKIFNLIGKEVFYKKYISGVGKNYVKLEADDFAPGVYMYSISNGITTATRRMVINKR